MIKKLEKNIQIGLDIGNEAVKGVAIAHGGLKSTLLGYSTKSVGDDIVKAIKEAYAELGTTKNSIVTSISGPAVIVRYVEMPLMSEEELASATRFEAEKVIPYNIEDIELDSVKIEDLSGNRMRVIIVGVKKDLVDSQIKMVYEAGLKVAVLDIDSFALMNAFINAGVDKTNVCALLNIGAKKSNLNIIKGGISYLSRDIDIGGNQITKAISDNLSLSMTEAQKIKEERLSSFSKLSADEKKDVEAPLTDMILRLVDELRLSFDFYENRYGNSVSNVYISGGASKAGVVADLLKESLGREASRWDPFTNMEISDKINKALLEEARCQLAVAAGLGLRRTD